MRVPKHLEEEIARLEAALADLRSRFPAHSIPPTMMARLDELEEQLQHARARLAQQATSDKHKFGYPEEQ